MKILWHSVAPWVGSGYGVQTATFAPRIQAMGYDLKISAYYGVMGATFKYKGVDVLPAYAKSYGTDIIVLHALHHFGIDANTTAKDFRKYANGGIIITLGDVWTFNAPLLPDMNVASWVPVDHETLPAIVNDWFKDTGAVPIAMSKFGQKTLQDNGYDALYVPHGIDTSIYRPGDKYTARDRMGVPRDAFVIAMVAANVGRDGSRKAFYEQILAFKELRKHHSDALLLLHTDAVNPWGVDIRHLLSDLPETAYRITDQYRYRIGITAEEVADIYRSADLFTNCSWGEGFGVPIVEAQACGVPVVVTDTTAMPELCGAGWKVPGEPMWHDSQHAWARRPFIGAIADAYKKAYELYGTNKYEELRAQAFVFAQDYDADYVLEQYWKPTLDTLEQALERRREEESTPRPVKTRVRESADGLLWIDRGRKHGDAVGWADLHEKELKPIIEPLLPEGGVMIDVGAHVGHWTIRLARKASHIYAVEANPDTAKTLRRNLALNDIDNVTVCEIAAWDEHTWLRMEDPNNQVAGGSARVVPLDDDQSDCAIPAMPLDDFLGEEVGLPLTLDLVKIDVEGADLHVLRGMSQILASFRPRMIVECHDVYGYYKRDDLEALLTELGYTYEVVFTYETQWTPTGVSDEVKKADYLLCTPLGA